MLANLAGSLDRALPVPLGTQLRGLIEFGIALGELSPGQRLPSVRELAGRANVAPMTVATVYTELRLSGLIETKPGAGICCRRAPQRRAALNGHADTATPS